MRHLRNPAARRSVALADTLARWGTSPSIAAPTTKASMPTDRWRSGCGGSRSSTSPAATSRSPTRTARCGWSRMARSTTTANCARELQQRGHRFTTGSRLRDDSRHLYEEHGDDFVEHLNGMFAFALWDARRRRLLVGRDRLGIKPLYFWTDAGALVFAIRGEGDPRASGRRGRARPRQPRPSISALGYVPAPRSIFRGIRKLPPGHAADRGARPDCERPLLARPGDSRPRVRGRRTGSSECARGIEESVRMQMVSDVPIGAFLSGGIDSSAVVAFMARAQRPPGQDLLDRLRSAVRRSATTTSCRMRGRSPDCSAPTTTRSSCGPTSSRCCPSCCGTWTSRIADTAFVTTYLVSEFARRDVTVILSGVGGDELFGGYRRYLGGHYQAQLRPAARLGAPSG